MNASVAYWQRVNVGGGVMPFINGLIHSVSIPVFYGHLVVWCGFICA